MLPFHRLKSGKDSYAEPLVAAVYGQIPVIPNHRHTKNLRLEITQMKTTYLLNKRQADGTVCLEVATRAEWLSAVNEDKLLPQDQRRRFIFDRIPEGKEMDCMIIEVPPKDHRDWDKDRPKAKQNRQIGKKFQHLSLDAPLTDSDNSGSLFDLIAADVMQVESAACDVVLMDELRNALAAWKPWAIELLELYQHDRKRTCTEALAEKYRVSPQTIRKYKRQFEEFVKKFLGGVSF